MTANALKRFAKMWCPPAIAHTARTTLDKIGITSSHRLVGPYASWQEAERVSTTYAAPVILDRVAASTAKLLRGEAVYERDSVTFDEIEWPWSLLAALGRQAAIDGGTLRVLDVGGSLGGTFVIARRFLDHRIQMSWRVVEQSHFVARAAQLAMPPGISFFSSVTSATESFIPNVVLASGVLQVLSHPHDALKELLSIGANTLIIDRTPCIDSPEDVLTVQQVPAKIFPASYPNWLFSRQRLLGEVKMHYREVASFDLGEQLMFKSHLIVHTGWVFERNQALDKDGRSHTPANDASHPM